MPSSKSTKGRQRPIDSSGRLLDRFLGGRIRLLRQKNALTIHDIAGQAGISAGMLSKVENGQASMSLDSLARVAQAFGVPVFDLFRDYNIPEGGAQLVKAGEGMEVVRRDDVRGHRYRLLSYGKGPRRTFEPFSVHIEDSTAEFPTFEHNGLEFLYMLSGRVEYRHGRQSYLLEPGDSLTFRGDVPHGPERLLEVPIHMLSVLIYSPDDEL